MNVSKNYFIIEGTREILKLVQKTFEELLKAFQYSKIKSIKNTRLNIILVNIILVNETMKFGVIFFY